MRSLLALINGIIVIQQQVGSGGREASYCVLLPSDSKAQAGIEDRSEGKQKENHCIDVNIDGLLLVVVVVVFGPTSSVILSLQHHQRRKSIFGFVLCSTSTPTATLEVDVLAQG